MLTVSVQLTFNSPCSRLLKTTLGAGCEFCTKYALGVLRELGVSDAEIDEAISVAMTVGASNPRLLAKKVRAENS